MSAEYQLAFDVARQWPQPWSGPGRARIVEGTVERFRPVGPGGHGSDRFTVAGVELQVPTSGVGFGQTARDGGPIREGLRARIHYVPTWGCEDLCGARILRLELAR